MLNPLRRLMIGSGIIIPTITMHENKLRFTDQLSYIMRTIQWIRLHFNNFAFRYIIGFYSPSSLITIQAYYANENKKIKENELFFLFDKQ